MKYESYRPPIAVILAAGIGSQMSPLTDDCPKCLLAVGGSVILERTIRNCLSCGISQIVLVLGHRSDQVKQFVDKTFRGIRVTYVINDQYRDTNSGYSLMLAASAVGTADFVKIDADVVFDTQILRRLTDSDLPNVLCIDRNAVRAGDEVKIVTDDQMRVVKIGKSVDLKTAIGKSIGIDKISAVTGPLLFAELGRMMDDALHVRDDCEAAYERLIDKGIPFHTLDVTGLNCTEIDTAEDLAAASSLFRSPITTVSRGQQRALDEAAEKEPNST